MTQKRVNMFRLKVLTAILTVVFLVSLSTSTLANSNFVSGTVFAPTATLADGDHGNGMPHNSSQSQMPHDGRGSMNGSMRYMMGNGFVSLSNAYFTIELHSLQVPMFHFNTSLAEGRFYLRFEKIIEYQDDNNNGYYESQEAVGNGKVLSLSSLKWDYNVVETDNEITVYLNSSTINQLGFENFKVSLINHFRAEESFLKFDILMENWPFSSPNSRLALEFSFMWHAAADLKDTADNRSHMSYQDEKGNVVAFFNMTTDLTVDGQDITDAAKLQVNKGEMEHMEQFMGNNSGDMGNHSQMPGMKGSDVNLHGKNFYINYPSFNETLVHDPIIGSTVQALLPGAASEIVALLQQIALSKEGYLASVGLLTIVILSSIVFYRRKKR